MPTALKLPPRWIEGVNHRQKRDVLPLRAKLLRHFVGQHAIGAPTHQSVRSLRLKSPKCFDL